MKRFECVIFSSLCKLKENDSKDKNIILFYPNTVSNQSIEKIYESLTMCVYLFCDTLGKTPRIVHLGGKTHPLSFHCQIIHESFLFAYGKMSAYDHDLALRGSALYDHLTSEFGCLACATNYTKVSDSIETFLSEFEVSIMPVFQCAIPRFMKVEPIVGQKAINLLRLCSRHTGVSGGCIFYRHQLIADSLPSKITRILAMLNRLKANKGSSRIWPENGCDEFLSELSLRQGVSLRTCYLSANSIQPMHRGYSLPSSSNSRRDMNSSPLPVELCTCCFNGVDKTEVPRLCCLATRTVHKEPKLVDLLENQHNHLENSKETKLTEDKPCAKIHEDFETFIAYIEAHSDISLCLLLRNEPSIVNQHLLRSLYKLCFVLLRDLELCILRAQDSSTKSRKNIDASVQYHAYSNSYRRCDAGDRLNPFSNALQFINASLRADDDLELVELSDKITVKKFGWRQTITYAGEG